MATISSSDNGYSALQRQLGEFQDDVNGEASRSKKQEANRLANAERNEAETIRKQEEAYTRTIDRARDQYAQSSAKTKEADRQDLNNFKKETYDRFGRQAEMDARSSRSQTDQFQTALAQRDKQANEQVGTGDERHNDRVEALTEKYQNDSDRALNNLRDSLNESQDNAVKQERASYRALTEDSNKKISELDRTRLNEISEQRHLADVGLDNSNRDASRRLDQAKQNYEKQSNRQELSLRDEKLNGAAALRSSHQKETQNLRDQLHDTIEAERAYMKERGQGTSDAVREFEQPFNDRINAQSSAFAAQVDKLKADTKNQEHYLDRSNQESLREKDLYFAGVIKKQNDENFKTQSDQANSFDRNRKEIIAGAEKTQTTQQQSFDKQRTKMAEDQASSLTEQAKSFQNTERMRAKNDSAQIQKLQKELQLKNTTGDTKEISPAAEANLRRAVANEYGKIQQADHERSERRLGDIHDNYREQLNQARETNDTLKTNIYRAVASERNQERDEFSNHIAETEFEKNTRLNSQESSHGRETELLNKNYARMMNRQARQSDEAMNMTKDDASGRINAVRQEAEFNAKTAQRSFSVRQNELIREYEKKLADQKSEYDGRLEDAKIQGQASAHEVEKRLKTQLDDQIRSYEQKLTQQTAQFSERERSMTQNFQDEIEKVKRSNALLVQKKS